VEQILVEWPLDLLALRQHTGVLFWSGDGRSVGAAKAARRPRPPALKMFSRRAPRREDAAELGDFCNSIGQ
jgi:hypothetical protein